MSDFVRQSKPGQYIDFSKFQDVTGPEVLQVEIRDDGTVVWIHVNGITLFRACRIEHLIIQDNRDDIPME